MAEPEPLEGDGYGALEARSEHAAPSGRRAALSIGGLLAACVFIALLSNGANGAPATLLGLGGEWSGTFTATTPLASTASAAIEVAQSALDKTLASNSGADASIGQGEGISGRWSSSFDPPVMPVLPSTGTLECCACALPRATRSTEKSSCQFGRRLLPLMHCLLPKTSCERLAKH